MKRQPSSDTQTNEDLRTMLKSMGMKNESDIQDALKDPRVHDLLQDKKKQKVLKRMSTQVTGAGSPFRRPVQKQGNHEIDRKKFELKWMFLCRPEIQHHRQINPLESLPEGGCGGYGVNPSPSHSRGYGEEGRSSEKLGVIRR